jgi:Rad3-related DNA helicase
VAESDWEQYVPEVGLRPQQVDALDQIWAAFGDGNETVMLEAPTGVGKSIVQLALARRMLAEGKGNTFIVTPQRSLQDQFRSWNDLAVMKGKGSYHCGLVDDGGETTAATAPCTLSQEVRAENPECSDSRCPFYSALSAATRSSVVVHNYASLLAQTYMVPHFSRRHLLCLDEGHTAADWVRNFATFELDRDQIRELDSGGAPPRADEFLSWFVGIVAEMEQIPPGLSDQLRLTLMRAAAFRSMLPSEDADASEVPWVATQNEYTGAWSVLPLKVSRLSRILTGLGELKLVVTATVLEPRLLAAELGLVGTKFASVRIDSAFPKDNRPIVKRYVGKMSMRRKDATMPKLITELVKIANSHPDEPGLVHTVSHALSKEVFAELSRRLIGRQVEILPQGGNRDATIKAFLQGAIGRNAILVGPGMMEGLDGKDDSCRWQVMCKVPWPSRGDPVVEHLMSMTGPAKKWSEAWYSWKTAQQTVQGFGRVVRTPTDFGVTYLLDSGFQRILDGGYVPRYVLDAVRR